MSKTLFIFAQIKPKKQFFEKARAAILNVIEKTRAEEGCHQFILHENREELTLYLYEEWKDEVALEEHYQQEYIKEVFIAYQEWLEEMPRIERLSKII